MNGGRASRAQTLKVSAACGTTRDSRRSGSELEQSDMMGMSEEPQDALGPKYGGAERAWTVIRMTALGRPSSLAGFGSKESRAIPQAPCPPRTAKMRLAVS
jgi:hypothetical protein